MTAARRLPRRAFAVALLALLFALCRGQAVRESVTIDEPLNLTAGYMAWKFHDYRLQESSGVLLQRWFALPLLAGTVAFPGRGSPEWRAPGHLGLRLTNAFFFHPANDPDRMVRAGRLMAAALALLALLAVAGWAGRLFGGTAGLLAGLLCALDPTVLAHGHLMTSDLGAALFFLMSAGCFWLLLRRLTALRLAASAGCFGLLLASKMSGGLAVPVAGLLLLFQLALGRRWPVRFGRWRRDARGAGEKLAWAAGAALVHAAAALLVLWACYGWQRAPARDWEPAADAYTDPRPEVFASLGAAARPVALLERSRLLPEAYVYGLAHTAARAAERPAYLDGRYGSTGWWWYFPYAFLVKTPPAAIALMLLGALAVGRRGAARGGRLRRASILCWADRTSPLWGLGLVYGAASVAANLDIGQRHLLPLYLPLFVLAGASVLWLRRGSRAMGAAVVLLAAGEAVSLARVYPHCLSYFNAVAGGPTRGYLRLTDSNVDWGQDLPSLARWTAAHPADAPLYLSWFGYDLPRRWGVEALEPGGLAALPASFSATHPLTCGGGTYCFSATYLILPGPPWDAARERDYRAQLDEFRRRERDDPPRPGDPASAGRWRPFLSLLAGRQCDRLRAYLMARKPDAFVGYSILVFRLSPSEVERALLPSLEP